MMNNINFSFSFGTCFLMLILVVFLLFYRFWYEKNVNKQTLILADKYFIISMLIRCLVFILFIFLIFDKTPFAITDDETYYKFAAGLISDETREYAFFLKNIYNIFGISTLRGRIVNIFLSSMTVYPITYIENSFSDSNKLIATKLFVFLPFQLFFCMFEIKDILLLWAVMNTYMSIKILKEDNRNILNWIITFIFIYISEMFRSTAGIVSLLVLILIIFFDKESKNKKEIFVKLFIILVFIIIIIIVFFKSEYGGEMILSLDRYNRWIETQINTNGIYNFLRIRTIKDIWKLPISCFMYIIQPLTGLYNTNRLYSDYGFILRIFDLPIIMLSILGIRCYLRKENYFFIIFLIPLIFLSAVNLTNTREFIYVSPFIYLFYTCWKNNTNLSKKSQFLIFTIAYMFLPFIMLYINI